MDVREKLVEIERAAEWFEKRAENTPMPMARKMFELAGEALREKANRVTVQEWISVKDRLPETEDVFLCWSKDLADMMFCYTSDFKQLEVTHWMPLPPAPKRETICCKDCENLMFSDCYGECAKVHKGIVNPNDTCEHAKRKPPKGE